VVRDPLPADPVRRGDVADGLDRRGIHELRLRWALSKPVRKVFYNLTVTGLSVAVALVIGTIEVGGLISSELDLSGSFWN
jgi:high-affinity nickel permease